MLYGTVLLAYRTEISFLSPQTYNVGEFQTNPESSPFTSLMWADEDTYTGPTSHRLSK